MVDHLHRSTSASALTSVQMTLVICTDGSILSHWVVFSFQARGDIWGLLALAFPPTSCPHSCSCNEAEHHRYVRGGKLCLAARNIYPNIYISYYCLYITSVVICYLFLDNVYSPRSSLAPELVGENRNALVISSVYNLRPG